MPAASIVEIILNWMRPTCSVSPAAFYKVIYVKIYGGLGNQLYQYALGKALAVNHSTLCKLDIRNIYS